MSSRWRGGRKPHDVGTGVVCASFGANGAWLSLGTVHPAHGFVEFSAAPVFDEAQRGSPDYVRSHRAQLADERRAFLALEPLPIRFQMTSALRARRGARSITQELSVRLPGDARPPPAIRLRFRGRLLRPPLAMITEVGTPPSPAGARTMEEVDGGTLLVTAPELRAEAVIRVSTAHEVATWRASAGEAELRVRWPAGQAEVSLRITGSLRVPPRTPGRHYQAAATPLRVIGGPAGAGSGTLALPATLRRDVERITRRALRYVRGCTALRVAPGRVTILTDHRLLPLSWTRDAYYQALLLLHAGDAGMVADHLRWLWLSCDRSGGTWARSHHADGRRKDEVYQADQQLYPLLELADYRRRTGRLPELAGPAAEGRDWGSLASEVLDDLAGRLSDDGLLPTDENAADDPAGLPYLLANQILAVHTLERLSDLAAFLDLRGSPAELAQRVRNAVERHFPREGPAGRLWAYAVDGRGGAKLYHDANDLPTAFAPLWGFCAPDDPLWRRTMDFSFSPANEAYVAGRYGGLGSGHTPGVWPLGLIQEWVARSLTGEQQAAEDALLRLIACSMSDGSLPEASEPASGRIVARHWFAWPGALLAALVAGAWD